MVVVLKHPRQSFFPALLPNMLKTEHGTFPVQSRHWIQPGFFFPSVFSSSVYCIPYFTWLLFRQASWIPSTVFLIAKGNSILYFSLLEKLVWSNPICAATELLPHFIFNKKCQGYGSQFFFQRKVKPVGLSQKLVISVEVESMSHLNCVDFPLHPLIAIPVQKPWIHLYSKGRKNSLSHYHGERSD